MAQRTRPIVAVTAACAGSLTLLVSVTSAVDFAYRNTELHVAIETAASVVAVLAAYLLYGRFRATRRLEDLALFAALLVLSLTNLSFSTILAISGAERSGFAAWAPLAGRVLAGGVLVVAAFAPARRVVSPRRALLAVVAATLALTLIAALFGALGPDVPRAIDPDLSPTAADRPRIVGDAWVLALQLVAMVLYAVAAIGFTRRAIHARDELLAWFAVGTTLAAFARLNYFLFPSVYSTYVYTGDILRVAFYLALLAGALRALGEYQRRAADLAVASERRRMARELHDGLAQELAFISLQSRRLAATGQGYDELASAAARALDESRTAITALADDGQRPIRAELAEIAARVARRGGARAQVEVTEDVAVSPDTQLALVRVVHEAVGNAVRHGGASEVRVRLSLDGGMLVLAVEDDGEGFDPAHVVAGATGGFGLVSMRERVERLGGELEIDARPGAGARIRARLPCDD